MKTRLTSEHWLFKKPIAHRGLHGERVVENGPTAFKKAIEKGFPIETDVQMSDDGVLFCYHDDDMKRVARLLADIRDTQSQTIKNLVIGENERILTFKEFLSLVDGKVPLLIEVKRQKKKGIEQKILDELKGYNGEYVIQSFDPFILKNFKKLAPEVIRGQLSDSLNKEKNFFVRKIVKKMSLNFLSKPDFCNVNIKGYEKSKKYAKGLPMLCWTVKCEEDKEYAEKLGINYVFENVFS